jgi:hypothetical protein
MPAVKRRHQLSQGEIAGCSKEQHVERSPGRRAAWLGLGGNARYGLCYLHAIKPPNNSL